jgi:N-succinyldiaminopimelate aminotransferase
MEVRRLFSGQSAHFTGKAMRALNPTFAGLGTTIFTVMSALANEHKAVNLGQGFPDEDGPAGVREAAAKALIDGPNQYPPMMGVPVLRQALARHAARHYGLDFNWEREIVVTSGATEALTDCLMAFLTAGDEAILISRPMIAIARLSRRSGPKPSA